MSLDRRNYFHGHMNRQWVEEIQGQQSAKKARKNSVVKSQASVSGTGENKLISQHSLDPDDDYIKPIQDYEKIKLDEAEIDAEGKPMYHAGEKMNEAL